MIVMSELYEKKECKNQYEHNKQRNQNDQEKNIY